MIVDTSALIAVLLAEPGYGAMLDALGDTASAVAAPSRLEFIRVASGRLELASAGEALLEKLDAQGLDTIAFDRRHAEIAAAANIAYGKGNGTGGKLNILDLMAYAVAIERVEPLLFTGTDFTTTDVLVHAVSRLE